jgi:hypothetical protein
MPAAPRPLSAAPAQPFGSAEQAWIWTMQALRARGDGARIRAGAGAVPRPCEPDDVMLVLDRLYRQRRIDLPHARALRIYGERGLRPDRTIPAEWNDARLWDEAIAQLDWPLRAKGLVHSDA